MADNSHHRCNKNANRRAGRDQVHPLRPPPNIIRARIMILPLFRAPRRPRRLSASLSPCPTNAVGIQLARSIRERVTIRSLFLRRRICSLLDRCIDNSNRLLYHPWRNPHPGSSIATNTTNSHAGDPVGAGPNHSRFDPSHNTASRANPIALARNPLAQGEAILPEEVLQRKASPGYARLPTLVTFVAVSPIFFYSIDYTRY